MRLRALLVLALACGASAAQADGGTTAIAPAQTALAHDGAVAQIIGHALAEGRAYERLEHLADFIGHRLAGEESLTKAIDWAAKVFEADGLANVAREPVRVPRWIRGVEQAELIAPVHRPLSLLALGGSVGTPPRGLEAEVLVVESFAELDAAGPKAKGKIVVFNHAMRADKPPFDAYGDAVEYRGRGASAAARHGAVAMLLRSVTTRSLLTPHTGAMKYAEDAPKIPAAALSVEDAALLGRLAAQGPVRVRLRMGAHLAGDAPSANVVAELTGREKPEEIVVLGAHIDSWDVGAGANDDGTGVAAVLDVARVLRRLDLRPRRTVRFVLFTNEENGLKGALAYWEKHKNDAHVAAIETDAGGGRPLGFSVHGAHGALAALQPMLTGLAGIGAGALEEGHAGADLIPMTNAGVLSIGMSPDASHYFDVHHTQADTFEKIDRVDLGLQVAALGVLAWQLADAPGPLPSGLKQAEGSH